MKKFTKLLGIVLIIALVMSMGTMALAEDTHSVVTIPEKVNGNTHTFNAVQIFTGTQAVDGNDNNPLGNIQYSSTVTGSDVVAALNSAFGLTGTAALASTATAAEVAKILGTVSDNDPKLKEFANQLYAKYKDAGTALTAGNNTLEKGYYLIVDTTNVDENDAKNAALLQVTKNVTITVKTSIPSVEKKVDDINDSTGETVAKKDSADYDVGDTVPFHITGTIGSDVDDFKSYKLIFTDTMEDGLKNDKSYTVKFDGTAIGTTNTAAVYYSVDTSEDQSFQITVFFKADTTTGFIPASYANKAVTIDYTATLTEDAVTAGVDGVLNTVELNFSNNPNTDDVTDEGPKDYNKVFTYTVEVDKVKEDETTKLPGAAFTLYKLYTAETLGDKTAVTEIKYNNGNDTYSIATDEKWVVVDTTTAGTDTEFKFEGIDDGIYLLVETTTPDGYNSVKPSKFEVAASHTEEGAAPADIVLETLSGTDKATAASTDLGAITLAQDTTNKAQLNTTIVNNSGTVLPSTGGIGTTIFYVVGSIMVVAAGVLLITKKRMGRE